VPETKPEPQTFCFGIYELDADTGDLRRDGNAQPRLREQALRILLMLLERPRDLVTREELRERLWAADTFVDFDHGLNTAINQLRAALGESAANSVFIQTVPRRGYRFIAPVETKSRTGSNPNSLATPAVHSTSHPHHNNSAQVHTAGEPTDATEPRDGRGLLSEAHELPSVSSGVTRTLFALIQGMYLSFYVIALAHISKIDVLLADSRRAPIATLIVLIVSAAAGIPTRLYLLAAVIFNYRGLNHKFLKLFPWILPFDELWALAPFLLIEQIHLGLALAATAALLYVPFAQRSLLLMNANRQSPTRF
jgi:cholera toxin transcriptional activator